MKKWMVILWKENPNLNTHSFYVQAETLLHAMAIAGCTREKFFSNYFIQNIVRAYF